MMSDWTCLIHGLKMSEHVCLYCCLCFKSLTAEECHMLPNGKREDVCNDCAKEEEEMCRLKGLPYPPPWMME